MKIAVNDYLELYTDDDKMGYVVDTRTGEKYAQTSLASILSKGYWDMIDEEVVTKGGPGSGHHNHAGIPGHRGGSAASDNSPIIPVDVIQDSYDRLMRGVHGARYHEDALYNHLLKTYLLDAAAGLEALGRDWADLDEQQRGKIKDEIVTRLSRETGIPYQKVNEIVGGWAETSNDTSYKALFIQNCIAEEFGMKMSLWQREHWQAVEIANLMVKKYSQPYREAYERNMAIINGPDTPEKSRVFQLAEGDFYFDLTEADKMYIASRAARNEIAPKLREEYERLTRDQTYRDVDTRILAGEALDRVAGTNSWHNRLDQPSYTKAEARKVLRAMYNDTQAYFQSKGIQYVFLYRGAGNYFDKIRDSVGKPIWYYGNAAESWSISARVAMSFGGAMLRKVPVKSILCTSRLGMGCIVEGEIVVMDNDEVKAQLIYV